MKLLSHINSVIINEGGNKAGTGPIKLEHIEPTLKKFTAEFSKAVGVPVKFDTLGSVGHKAESGDLDLSLDITYFVKKEGDKFKSIWKKLKQEQYETKIEALKARAKSATYNKLAVKALCQFLFEAIDKTPMGEYLVEPDSAKVQGTLFFKYPVVGTDNSVQIDVNVGHKEWLNFSYYSDKNIYSKDFQSKFGPLKGLHRTQLLIAMFKAKDYVFRHSEGVANKEGEVKAHTPQEAVDLLNELYKSDIKLADVSNYETLMNKISKFNTKDKERIIKEYMTILHSAGYENIAKPKDLQSYIDKWKNDPALKDVVTQKYPKSKK